MSMMDGCHFLHPLMSLLFLFFSPFIQSVQMNCIVILLLNNCNHDTATCNCIDILFYYSFTVSSTEGLQQHVLQP